jgi:hypothetical protein
MQEDTLCSIVSSAAYLLFLSCPFMLLLVAFCLDYCLWPYEPPLASRDALLGWLVIWLSGVVLILHIVSQSQGNLLMQFCLAIKSAGGGGHSTSSKLGCVWLMVVPPTYHRSHVVSDTLYQY